MLYDIIVGAMIVGAWTFMIIGNTWIKGLLFNKTLGKKGTFKDDLKTGAGLVYYETVIKKSMKNNQEK